jgi:cation:H+ antiporter
MNLRATWPFLVAILVTLPGIALRLAGVHLDPGVASLVSGMAILAASFLLLWACDAAQADVSQAIALAVVALVAVLPEYAVDMYFTWQAGQDPAGNYAHYAIANMTGANRLLIGVGWALVAAFYWYRRRKAVTLNPERRLELGFLGLATAYAFVIPIKGTLAWYDGLVFLGLYVWYMRMAMKHPCAECEAPGPAEVLVRMPRRRRLTAVALLFAWACGAILANAEPFCEGLIGTGKALNINEFLLVQWLAPIASEAPEFLLALMFAWRGNAALALGSLLSSKLNQWTLLVGMIPGVYAVSSGQLATPIPMGGFQMHEILLTAAQSFLAVILLTSLRFTIRGAVLLFVLFSSQLILPEAVRAWPWVGLGLKPEDIHPFFSATYCVLAVLLLFRRRKSVWNLVHGVRGKDVCPIDGKP